MVDVYLKCYGCRHFHLFSSQDLLMQHQIKTGHKNDQASRSIWAEFKKGDLIEQ